jgi:hypothetical protein
MAPKVNLQDAVKFLTPQLLVALKDFPLGMAPDVRWTPLVLYCYCS